MTGRHMHVQYTLKTPDTSRMPFFQDVIEDHRAPLDKHCHLPLAATGDADVVYGTLHTQTNLHHLHFPFKDIIDTNQIHSQHPLSHRCSQIHTAAQVTADRFDKQARELENSPSRTAGHAVRETVGGHRGLLFAPV